MLLKFSDFATKMFAFVHIFKDFATFIFAIQFESSHSAIFNFAISPQIRKHLCRKYLCRILLYPH